METAKIVVELIDTLAWPCLILFLVFCFRGYVGRMFERLVEDSDEIESSTLGISIRFREQLSKVVEQIPEEIGAAKQELNSQLGQIAEDQFRVRTAEQ